jgi:uncharacterized protein (DUF2126 family)/transglutaminase-like putative cysteine protease
MAIRVAITHRTTYRYDRLVTLSPHVVRLRPAPHCRTPIEAYSLRVTPDPHFINWQQDPFGNHQARLVFPERVHGLEIEVDLVAELAVLNPFDFFLEEYARHIPFRYEAGLGRALAPYLTIEDDGPRLRAFVAGVDRREAGAIDFLVDLNRRVERTVRYTLRFDPGVKSCEETLADGEGACRDSGWLLVQTLRHLGLAARFVSGYLVQLAPDERPIDGPAGPAQDFTDLHAWAEVYLPGAGWIGLDPTSGLLAGEGHIPLACTPDVASAAAISGSTSECRSELAYENRVRRIHEDPRVTKPYDDDAWTAIDALGHAVDRQLDALGVRLTMGGEPTFVSVDDLESAEWNVAADGEHKRRLAMDLVHRLRPAFAPGAALYCGQGKWYPGEPLPRWKRALYWRRDGVPVWERADLFADPERPGAATVPVAGRFTASLAEALGVDAAHVLPAYEDAFYFLWAEGRLPVDVDPYAADLTDERERRRLAELLDGDLGSPVGWVLPLGWDAEREAWRSCAWVLRRGPLRLLPGDSPLGLRLPLASLPAAAGADDELPRDPHAPRPPLGAARLGPGGSGPANSLRTALAVEVRAGRVHVFLPPVAHVEHALSLLHAIEITAAALETPVVLEGYEPPEDWRLRRLAVTPDPGVLEVNVHPAESWDEVVATTTTLYAEARAARLATEKFLVDGRHTGTGGGNHLTLGGPTPSESPLLRRPDLLRSLLTYWQHHPGLSYLFSGLFVGPTSQAPRVDEARLEQLYELEVAFAQIPDGEVAQPWLADRLLRNLLVDVTGNTHRAEFCIDKLYSPDSASGRLGLLELRAFEMPPHARMSCVQALLLRTLVAWFWQRPYRHRLVRWGTELHDRFLLPHYVEADMREVVRDLREAGYAFEESWLAPFLEFRFPRLGKAAVGDVTIELRMAIEPWHVLGEEVSRAGTARYVDSSLERLQARVRGLTDGRHVVTCNGRRLLMHGTGTLGELVGGVRYRAWQPSSALHPTIGVHSPLVFDVVDTWNGRSVGGCTYHVAHPGGRSYETVPVNAYEAEARRASRFWDHGHTPDVLRPPPRVGAAGRFVARPRGGEPVATPLEEVNEEFPHTLDLRRAPTGPFSDGGGR